MIVVASLFAATLANLRATELGFNQESLLLADIDTTRAGYEQGALNSFYSALRNRFGELPGVEDASLSWSVLAGGGTYVRSATVPGSGVEPAEVNVQVVGESFFETLQIDILAARPITRQDVDTAQAVAVVDQRFAQTFFRGEPAVDRTIEVAGEGTLRIVGVSANARHDLIRGDVRPVVYFTYAWDPHPLFNMVVELRTRGDPLAYADTLRAVVRELNPQVAVSSIRTQAANTDRTIHREILFVRLGSAVALLALVITCVGLYGTISYAMARRTAEIAVRTALGATRSSLMRLALRQVLAIGLAGLMIGLPAALAASQLIESFLWGVAPTDPLVLIGTSLVVLAAVVLAGYTPARRASRVDPLVALRSE